MSYSLCLLHIPLIFTGWGLSPPNITLPPGSHPGPCGSKWSPHHSLPYHLVSIICITFNPLAVFSVLDLFFLSPCPLFLLEYMFHEHRDLVWLTHIFTPDPLGSLWPVTGTPEKLQRNYRNSRETTGSQSCGQEPLLQPVRQQTLSAQRGLKIFMVFGGLTNFRL